jgi:hypothetical protein
MAAPVWRECVRHGCRRARRALRVSAGEACRDFDPDPPWGARYWAGRPALMPERGRHDRERGEGWTTNRRLRADAGSPSRLPRREGEEALPSGLCVRFPTAVHRSRAHSSTSWAPRIRFTRATASACSSTRGAVAAQVHTPPGPAVLHSWGVRVCAGSSSTSSGNGSPGTYRPGRPRRSWMFVT